MFGGEQLIDGDITAIWSAWTDMERFPQWDPREEQTRLNGPFAVDTTGYLVVRQCAGLQAGGEGAGLR